MKRTAVVSLLLVLCLLFTAVAPAMAVTIEDINGDSVKNYLALGGSVTAGAGLNGSAAYPELLLQQLGDVKLTDLSVEGFRAEELALLLSDSKNGDSYTAKHFPNLAERRNEFRNEVKKADLITIEIGADSFGKFLVEQLESGAYNTDLHQTLTADEARHYTMAKAMMSTMLLEQWGVANTDEAGELMDLLSYALFSYMGSFDAIISGIRSLNAKATIVVLGISYPTTGVELPIQVSGVSSQQILNAFVDIANLHAAYNSDYSNQYYYAYSNVGTVEFAAAGKYQYPTAAGHQVLANCINSAIGLKANGADCYDILTKQVVSNLTGTDAKTPSEAAKGDYVGDNTSYVALGDGSAVNGGAINAGVRPDSLVYGSSYTQKLADKLGVSFTNLAVDGEFSEATLEKLPQYQNVLKDADIVTLGYDANAITWALAKDLEAVKNGGSFTTLNWGEYLDDASLKIIHDTLEQLRDSMAAKGMDGIKIPGLSITATDVMVAAIERYAYEVVALVFNYPEIVTEIHKLNPDATVVLVGMHNPMERMSLTFTYDGETTDIPLVEYMGLMVEAVNSHYQLYAMTHENVVYVEASEAETFYVAAANSEGNTNEVIPAQISVFAMRLMNKGAYEYDATDAGYTYIANQIFNSLSVRIPEPDPEPQPPVVEPDPKPPVEKKWGDANKDGKVSISDAIHVLRRVAGLVPDDNAIDLEMADVDGNGRVGISDAIQILRKIAGLIDKFPAEG